MRATPPRYIPGIFVPMFVACHGSAASVRTGRGAGSESHVCGVFIARRGTLRRPFPFCREPRAGRIHSSGSHATDFPEVGPARRAVARLVQGQDLAVYEAASRVSGRPAQNSRRVKRGGTEVPPRRADRGREPDPARPRGSDPSVASLSNGWVSALASCAFTIVAGAACIFSRSADARSGMRRRRARRTGSP